MIWRRTTAEREIRGLSIRTSTRRPRLWNEFSMWKMKFLDKVSKRNDVYKVRLILTYPRHQGQ